MNFDVVTLRGIKQFDVLRKFDVSRNEVYNLDPNVLGPFKFMFFFHASLMIEIMQNISYYALPYVILYVSIRHYLWFIIECR